MKKVLWAGFISLLLMACVGKQGPTGPQGDPSMGSVSVSVAGADFILDTIPKMVNQISITVGGPGIINYLATGYFFGANTGGYFSGRASLSADSTLIDWGYLVIGDGNDTLGVNIGFVPYAISRSFTVSTAGTYTMYLVADAKYRNQARPVSMVHNNITATYIPR